MRKIFSISVVVIMLATPLQAFAAETGYIISTDAEEVMPFNAEEIIPAEAEEITEIVSVETEVTAEIISVEAEEATVIIPAEAKEAVEIIPAEAEEVAEIIPAEAEEVAEIIPAEAEETMSGDELATPTQPYSRQWETEAISFISPWKRTSAYRIQLGIFRRSRNLRWQMNGKGLRFGRGTPFFIRRGELNFKKQQKRLL